jgi:membrane protease YdiL (CAAX protease family)
MLEPQDNQSAGHNGYLPAILLVALLVLLFSGSLISLHKPRENRADHSAQQLLESIAAAKQSYLLLSFPQKGQQTNYLNKMQKQTLDAQRKLVKAAPGLSSLLRLAIMQNVFHDPTVKDTLDQIDRLPNSSEIKQIASSSHLQFWRPLLLRQPFPPGISLANALAKVNQQNLGWYGLLARAEVYHAFHMPDYEASAKKEALLSGILLMLLSGIGMIAGLTGAGLGLALFFFFQNRRHSPSTPLPKFFLPRHPPALDRKKANFLYYLFIFYLAQFAILRYVAPYILKIMYPGHQTPSLRENLMLSLALTAVASLIPLLILLVVGRRYNLKAPDIGLKSDEFWIDILWGVGGYLILLPLIWIVTIPFSYLFRHFDTPTNPAVLAFSYSGGAMLKILLFAEAAAVAPFVEETMFRGVFFRGLSTRMRPLAAMLISSGVFAILHPQLPLGFPAIFLLGFLFNMLYYQRGSLIPDITAHIINNGAIFLLLTVLLGK